MSELKDTGPGGTEVLLGEWQLDLAKGLLRRQREPYDEIQLNRRLSKVLDVLVSAGGEIVPSSMILEKAWQGRVVSADSISTAIYQLRKVLGDDSSAPKYIETIPNEGYRLTAAVSEIDSHRVRKRGFRWASAAAVMLVALIVLPIYIKTESVARTVYVPPVQNSTGIAANDGVSVLFRSRIMNMMGQFDPHIVATVSDNVASKFTLESEMVGCDAGPAVIFRLIETDSQRHVWSQHYDMRPNAYESEVLDLAIKRISKSLEASSAGTLVFEAADKEDLARKL